MIKVTVISFALMGCTPLHGQLRNTEGKTIEVAYVFMQPLCLALCSANLSTTGSDVDTIGQGASGAATQTSSISSGGVN